MKYHVKRMALSELADMPQ